MGDQGAGRAVRVSSLTTPGRAAVWGETVVWAKMAHAHLRLRLRTAITAAPATLPPPPSARGRRKVVRFREVVDQMFTSVTGIDFAMGMALPTAADTEVRAKLGRKVNAQTLMAGWTDLQKRRRVACGHRAARWRHRWRQPALAGVR